MPIQQKSLRRPLRVLRVYDWTSYALQVSLLYLILKEGKQRGLPIIPLGATGFAEKTLISNP